LGGHVRPRPGRGRHDGADRVGVPDRRRVVPLAALLGGRGWGWITAWFNLLGLVTVLAAINVGTVQFAAAGFFACDVLDPSIQLPVVSLVTATQAILNHLGVRVTRVLTDFSGWWILLVTAVLTVTLLACAPTWDWSRLTAVTNYSGVPAEGDPVWPRVESLGWVFALGLLLPAYTITGFDASAHVAEETVHAAEPSPAASCGRWRYPAPSAWR